MKKISTTTLDKAKSKLNTEIGNIERIILPFLPEGINDSFGVFYQPSDGFVLEFNAKNVPLDLVINHINSFGELSYDFLIDNSI